MRSFGSLGGGNPLLRASNGDLYGTTVSGGSNASGTIFRITTNGLLTIVYSFTGGEDGSYPNGLIQANDGNFYGTTREELGRDAGTVFRMTPDGALTTVYSFTGLNDGGRPNSLVQASDGFLYGTTIRDGASGNGTVFRITTNGVLTTLYSFGGSFDGANPYGDLLQARDGHLYGTTINGGMEHAGTIFRITTAGAFTTIYRLNRTNDGAHLWAGLMQASDGALYGATARGGIGTNDYGTVFRITLDGVFTRLRAFSGGNGGQYPYARLVQASNGSLYGTTQSGGTGGDGTVFRISTNGAQFSVYHSFNWANGAGPFGGLVLAGDGNLYGATVGGGAFRSGTAFRITPGGSFTLLQSLPSAYTGVAPTTGLAAAGNGWLYGTTLLGGASNRGTIFGLATDGTFTPLHSFAGGRSGESPRGELLAATDGNLYGTTLSGGTNDAGTVFRITPGGAFTLLHSFTGGSGGASVWSGLVQGRDGHLYGTTGDGGATGNGTAFRITLGGALTTFYSFTTSVGGGPRARLIQGSDHAFYGTSIGGGTSGQGTVYRLTTNGVLTILRSFTDGTNGYYLRAPLVQASDGRLYGTTDFGGTRGFGTIFRITTNGTFATLQSFTGNNGERPSAGLIQASDGNLYGTTYGNFIGGRGRAGSVFRITTNGAFTTLYTFTGGDDGAAPSEVVQATDGNLYGTTYQGGGLSAGTAFRILIAPPVIEPPMPLADKCVFGFRTVVRQRYAIEARPGLSQGNWVVYTTLDGNGSLSRLVVPMNYYPEYYFRVRRQ